MAPLAPVVEPAGCAGVFAGVVFEAAAGLGAEAFSFDVPCAGETDILQDSVNAAMRADALELTRIDRGREESKRPRKPERAGV